MHHKTSFAAFAHGPRNSKPLMNTNKRLPNLLPPAQGRRGPGSVRGACRSYPTYYHRHRAGGDQIDRPRLGGDTGGWLVCPEP